MVLNFKNSTPKMKKVKGFTIIEVLIAMILGSLAIAFSAWAFLIISSNFKRSLHDYDYHTEVLQFRYVLENDMEKATNIFYQNNAFKIGLSDSTYIYYDFNQKDIVRKKELYADTFHVETLNISQEYENNKQNMINFISFDIALKDSIWGTLRFFKQYPESLGLIGK